MLKMSGEIDKVKRIKSLRSGKGIQYLLNTAAEIFGNPMLIHDMDYKRVAVQDGVVTDDLFWNEFITDGRLSEKTVNFCKYECFIDDVASCDGVTYLISDQLKYDRIFGQLYNKYHMPVADMVAVAYNRPFETGDMELYKVICDKMSKEMGLIEYYQTYGQEYQDSIVKMLLDGGIEDKGLYAGHVANLDKGLKTNIFIAVADVSKYTAEHGGISRLRESFRQSQPAFKYFIYSDYIIIFLSTNRPTLNIKRDMKGLCEVFERENIYAGISGGFENLYEIRKYYDQAVGALNAGLAAGEGQSVFRYAPVKD